MNPWFDHESSSSLAVVILIQAALMPRFDRVHNSPPHDFRALVEDLRATQPGEFADRRESPENQGRHVFPPSNDTQNARQLTAGIAPWSRPLRDAR
ncbi:hypothetical protein [Bradyrhizobium amphicarpaeae]|uniref:hypothetical protein n=1 Tax=Bradyrhizobium amphicarpaeae TaxID=1404768 RepID=UPI00138FD578|nr:hypothetical protein [Bradyrhizobium amphicarpaeae]